MRGFIYSVVCFVFDLYNIGKKILVSKIKKLNGGHSILNDRNGHNKELDGYNLGT